MVFLTLTGQINEHALTEDHNYSRLLYVLCVHHVYQLVFVTVYIPIDHRCVWYMHVYSIYTCVHQ